MLVKFFALYREIAGCKSCKVEAPQDVLALLRDLSARWPEFRDVLLNEDGTEKADDTVVLVNGYHIGRLDGTATKLTDADTVAISPVIGGG